MTELVMTAIFFYSIYKIVDGYPVISVINYLLSKFVGSILLYDFQSLLREIS